MNDVKKSGTVNHQRRRFFGAAAFAIAAAEFGMSGPADAEAVKAKSTGCAQSSQERTRRSLR